MPLAQLARRLTPIRLFTDSKSLFLQSGSTSTSYRDMRLISQIGDIREAIEKKEIELNFISNNSMLADCFTKENGRRDILIKSIVDRKVFTC